MARRAQPLVAAGRQLPYEGEHVILVALVVNAADRTTAHARLLANLPRPSDTNGWLDSWWVAEDDRTDRSDNDSAVFCKPGRQVEARYALLHVEEAW